MAPVLGRTLTTHGVENDDPADRHYQSEHHRQEQIAATYRRYGYQ
jgi:hypothetical protein